MQCEIVVDGIVFGEGPVWCADGTLVCTCVATGVLHRVWPDEHRHAVIADTGGGANGAAPVSDGGFLVTQNGGVDFALIGRPRGLAYRPVTPGLQRVWPDGRVDRLLDGGFRAPNDLVVGADGTVYFTDPPHPHDRVPGGSSHGDAAPPVGRVWAWSLDGGLQLLGDGFHYPNGIGLDRDGHIVIVEGRGLLRVFPGGGREWVSEDIGGGDGFCLDVAGNYYAVSRTGNWVNVIDPEGTIVDELEAPDGHLTNCCFGGSDGRSLFATDGGAGTVVVWPSLPVAGAPVHAWPAP